MRNSLLVAVSAVCLSACSLAPEYEPPTSVLDNSPAQSPGQAITPNWQQVYQDPVLQKLIRYALENNRDVQIAQLQVAQLKQLYRIEETADWPKLSVLANSTRQRVAPDVASTTDPQYSTTHQVDAVLTAYEIDFFGRIDNMQEAALADYVSGQAARAAIRQNVVALVATRYFNLLQLNSYVNLQQQIVESQQASYLISQNLAAQGVIAENDILVATSQLRAAESQLIALQDLANQAYWQLNTLLALPKDTDILAEVRNKTLQTDAVLPLPSNLSSDVLRNRPDVASAEQKIIAANANIGVARAAFYPSITLVASGGFASSDLDDLFSSDSRQWMFSPQLNLPIFNAGELNSQLEIARLQKQEEIANYQQTIENAFSEFYSTLKTATAIQQQLKLQTELSQLNQRQLELSQNRLEQGIDNELQYQAQYRLWLSQQQALLEEQLNYVLNQVTLFKTIGGSISV